MNGLVRGRKTRTTIPAKDGKRAGDLLNRDFTAPFPNHSWVTDFTYVASGRRTNLRPVQLRSNLRQIPRKRLRLRTRRIYR
jgi:transposase InsO family protein